MKISDEMRELADRIDREMIELPKDCCGEVIHVGDTVRMDDGRSNAEVVKLCRVRYSWHVGCRFSDGTIKEFFANLVKVIKPYDSLERIADELEEQAGSITKDGCTWQEDAIHDFSDRIRKLAGKDGER